MNSKRKCILLRIFTLLILLSGCSLRKQSVVVQKTEQRGIFPSKPTSTREETSTINEILNKTIPHGRTVFPEQVHKSDDDDDHLVNTPAVVAPVSKKVEHKPVPKKGITTRIVELDERMVKLDFDNEDLATMLNHFAALQKKNLVLPQGADAINQKITFKLANEIPLREVQKYLDMFLDLAGYSRVPHGIVERIVRNDPNVTRELLPLYVGVEPKDLPNSDERIRAVYYLKNLRVPENESGVEPVSAILTSVLSGNRSIMYDSRANAIIVADKANLIRSAMALILDLDSLGSKDVIRAMSLYNSSAGMVSELIKQQITVATGDEQAGIKTESGKYFSSGLRVIPDTRTNSLFIMGREPAVERLQDFIREYIDVPSDVGASILHFYELQYLSAETFAPVLKAIVSQQQAISSMQSTQQQATSPTRAFQNVVVVPEVMVAERAEGGNITVAGQNDSSGVSASAPVLGGSVYRGGNRIIVTALRDDWKRIERLIKQLDQPQLQVLVQVLIIDLDVTNNNILATQLRNPSWMQLPNGFAFQSAQLVNPILDGPVSGQNPPFIYSDPTTVAADLLKLLSGGLSAAGLVVNQPGNAGSMIVSFNDPSATTPGIWAFMQWLEKFFTTKVLQHPYIVVQNYNRGEEYISDIRRVPGPATTGEGGAIAVKEVDIPAAIRVAVVPRASSTERLNLQISITIDQFEGTTANRVTRQVHTNVNLNSGNMLVLGGLTSYQELYTESETPILGSIPILKWFFTNTQRSLRRTNLVAFITPTIIEPRMPEGMNAFTKSEARRNYKLMRQDELLSQLKEPISYLFFNDRNDNLADMMDQYMATGKGDFVFDDVGPVLVPSDHKCDPCKKDPELKDIDPTCAKKTGTKPCRK